jgi:hypothetical protein
MTEQEWLDCADPEPMLKFLLDKASNRKAKLFICGMCRLNWQLLYDTASQKCVEVVERFVDGRATDEELSYAQHCAECPTFGYDFQPATWRSWTETGEVPASVQRLVEMGVLSKENLLKDEPAVDPEIKGRLAAAADLAFHASYEQPLKVPCLLGDFARLDGSAPSLLRCIFGNPFCPVAIEPAWFDHTIPKLARAIYDDRAFDRMAILADALEEAGCTNLDILNHCRQSGVHVRGCWVLDLLLGKE